MYFADESVLLVLIRWPPGGGESGHPHLLGILPDLTLFILCVCVFVNNPIQLHDRYHQFYFIAYFYMLTAHYHSIVNDVHY